MHTCSFFGHSLCPDSIKPVLKKNIEELIKCGINCFLLGDRGDFDILVLKTIKDLQEEYEFSYKIILSYIPQSKSCFTNDPHSIYPEELAVVPKRFAIEYRNRYLVENSDCFICYITHNYGGAVKFARKAKRMGKTVINISDNADEVGL